MRSGKWKPVAKWKEPWELYDKEADRTEMHNLAKERPDLVKELASVHDNWAARTNSDFWPGPEFNNWAAGSISRPKHLSRSRTLNQRRVAEHFAFITLIAHPFPDASAQFFESVTEFRIRGEITRFMRVCNHVIEFFSRMFVIPADHRRGVPVSLSLLHPRFVVILPIAPPALSI